MFILSLSVSDLISGMIASPLWLYRRWVFNAKLFSASISALYVLHKCALRAQAEKRNFTRWTTVVPNFRYQFYFWYCMSRLSF